MASLDEFSQNIRRYGRRIEVNAPQAVRKVALMAHQTIVVATPVDTGMARSNWIVTISSPFTGTVPPNAPAPGRDGHGKGEGGAGSTGSANIQLTIEKGRRVIATYRGEGSVFIANNLPYIKRLNEGWSAQAPSGYVEQAVAAAREEARRQRLLS